MRTFELLPSRRCLLSRLLFSGLAWFGVALFFAAPITEGNESFDFLERFALAEDRGAVLGELVPGTEDFYYYSALHAQQEGRFAEVEELLEPWVNRHGETPRVTEIRHRQALLRYSEDAETSRQYLIRALGLRFDHEQARLDRKPDFPTTLEEELVSWDAYLARALQGNRLADVKSSGLDRIIRDNVPLQAAQRRELLGRLVFPDSERLVGLIAADLRTPESRGFGEFPIHLQLTLAQLNELAGLMPELASHPKFVDAKLLRLRPGGDVLLEHSGEERRAYLNRLWDYVSGLDPAFNSLKVSVLYQKLLEARKAGEYPLEDFLSYLRLPRPAPYMSPRYLQEANQQLAMADLNADFSPTTGFPPIGNDEALVRHFLERAFRDDDSYQRFAPYLRDEYLKAVFAETKLLFGLGDAATHLSMLTPAQVQAIRERVEISFPAENPDLFAAGDEVTLKVELKNIKELLVKVYELNAYNYFLDEQREINTDLNLDGLVANEETRYEYDEPAMIRHEKSFSFDSMRGKRGVWVVELIGNGISSRALIRKGKLQYLSRTTPGGELVQVISEENEWVKDAWISFGGRDYLADAEGSILLPFSTAGKSPMILNDGEISSFVRMDLPREEYTLETGFFLEQESLLAGRETSVSVRPQLHLNGQAVSVALLEEATLRIRTTDLDGVESLIEVGDFALFDDRESLQEFRVPARLRAVEVTLEATVPLVSEGDETVTLAGRREFFVNGTDLQSQTFDLFLSRFEEGYRIEVLGKSGEPLADRPVSLVLTHTDFSQPYSVVLKSDANGVIELGELEGIAFLEAVSEGAGQRDWVIRGGRYSHPGSLHALAGEAVTVPLADPPGVLTRSDLAFFEMRSGVPFADLFNKASLAGPAVRFTGLEPGDYRLFLRREQRIMDLHVTDAAAEVSGYALSGSRHLQLSDSAPLSLSPVTRAGDKVMVKVENADEFTRVHLIATRFLPQFDPYESLTRQREMPLYRITRGSNHSLYLSGRDIGEEYRYILERRNLVRYPGNMLQRPGLLLNPWELNETRTEVDEATAGEDYRQGADMKEASRSVPTAAMESAPLVEPAAVVPPSLRFLGESSLVLGNLEPNAEGIIEVDASLLEGRQHLQVVALNTTSAASRQLALPAAGEANGFRDLRLKQSLDSERVFTRQKKVTLLNEGETLVIDDLRSAEMEVYSSLAEIYAVLLSINEDPDFAKFSFVTRWNALEPEEKRRLYSEHACHELHYFLAQKDPAFFAEVVAPYLANKKDRTFLDLYLLGENLEAFSAPWEFSRLNVVERILLGSRLGGAQRDAMVSHVESLHDLIPPDVAMEDRLFSQALRGRRAGGSELNAVMPGGGGLAISGALAMPEQPAVAARAMPAPKAGPGAVMLSRSAAAADGFGFGAAGERELEELRARAAEQRLFRQIDATKEWAENNYFELPIRDQNADLVTVNGFWRDFARHDGEGGFYSREFAAATRNFTEMMFALSVLDLPFEAGEHELKVDEVTLTLTASSPVIVFHEEIEEGRKAEGDTPVLVSQNFYRADDRFRFVNGEREDKFVSDEFLTGVIYGSQIVVTNPTSSRHRLDLLVQIPEGSVPVAGSDYTKSYPFALDPFSTEKLEVSFYFPRVSGEAPFAGYPVQVSKQEEVIAAGSEASFAVVERLSKVDEASWEYLSQEGSEEEVLGFLQHGNLLRIDLSRIAWRMKESREFFEKATAVIAQRHGYDETLWSYGLHHGVTSVAGEYLKHQEGFLNQAGLWIESDLVSVDPVARNWYEHLEYSPLVNARAHRLGRERSILNDRFRQQYRAGLKVLSYKPELSAEDRLAITAYLFLQDRIGEGLAWHARIEPEELASRIQYDYLSAYAAFYREEPAVAEEIAAGYRDYPVTSWASRFDEVSRQIEAMSGNDGNDGRNGENAPLSPQDPFLELTAEGREAELNFRGIDQVQVNYYEMDLEFLFSSKPFVSGGSGQFAYIKPNLTEEKVLPAAGDVFSFEIPEVFDSKNVLVEVVGAGQRATVAVYSNRMQVQLSERNGELFVKHETEQEAISKAYVKVYARMKDGAVRFFKDGYTDLRGRFDYLSLSTNELDQVEKLSLLVMSEKDGSLITEVDPPRR